MANRLKYFLYLLKLEPNKLFIHNGNAYFTCTINMINVKLLNQPSLFKKLSICIKLFPDILH